MAGLGALAYAGLDFTTAADLAGQALAINAYSATAWGVLTDARTHRGISGAPVVVAAPGRRDLPWLLLGVHSTRFDMGSRDLLEDESLGLNATWYPDIITTLTEPAAPTPVPPQRKASSG